MQTRQKVTARTLNKEHAGPTVTRHQRQMVVSTENNKTELITSSARKTKTVGPPKKSRDGEAPKLQNTRSSRHGRHNTNKAYGIPLDNKKTDTRNENCVLDTIFSPAFHIVKDSCDAIHDKAGSAEDSDMQNVLGALLLDKATVDKSCCEEYLVSEDLSPEVSAIYLAMQSSKLECVDEPCQDTVATDVYMEADESDEYDDFDPYLFIRNLPELSAIVPTFRPTLLPKKTRSCPSTSLVLDLDETLVHSSLEPCEDADFTFPINFNFKDHTVYVKCRPYLKDFLERVSSLFEIIIFTASQSIYAEQLLNVLDPKRRLFRHRVYRESCVYVDGNYLKDLSILGRDLSHVIIVDNSPQAFGFQVDNGIPIESWFDDRSDEALLSLLPFLESLVGADDVRPLIAKKFNLREKITSAAYPSLLFSR